MSCLRCGCGPGCEKLIRDGRWNSRHGSAGFACRIPASTGTRQLRRFGYPSKAEAKAAAEDVGKLLDLATDDLTRRKIGDLVMAAKRGAPLPSVEDVRRRLGLGLDSGASGETMGEWLDGWLASKRRTKRASTVRGYETHIRVHLKPVIGDLPLERVNTGHVEAVLAAVPGSAGTRHRVLATLRAALNAAVKQRRISWNPCAGIELEPEDTPEARRWTPAEAARFIMCTASDPLGLAFRVMVLTGCRRGELCGLRWDGADLDRGVLTVSQTLLQLGGKLAEGKPKTRAGERLIFLDAETAGLLREARKAHPDFYHDHGISWTIGL